MKLSPNEAAYCLKAAGFEGDLLIDFVAMGIAESDLDTEALGHRATTDPLYGNYDHGFMQISNKWWGTLLTGGSNWRDPMEAARDARAVFLETERIQRAKGELVDGRKAWQVFISGSYLKFLPAARFAVQYPLAPPAPVSITVTVNGNVVVNT
jgi:hypothetical protein